MDEPPTNAPLEEPLPLPTAELIVTFPSRERQLAAAAVAAAVVAKGARIYRSAAGPPWIIKAEQGELSTAVWRERLVALVEVLLPREEPA